jgi:hypothetical protein
MTATMSRSWECGGQRGKLPCGLRCWGGLTPGCAFSDVVAAQQAEIDRIAASLGLDPYIVCAVLEHGAR